MFALTGKGSSRFSSTGDAKAPAPFPGSKLLTWQHGTELIPCFPNLTAQRESCWQVWQVFECISNPRQSRNDLNNWAALFVPVCWFFEVTSVIYRWGRKSLLPDICSDRGGAACPGMLEPSALSAARRGAWRCNYSSDSSFELSSAGSGFSLSVWGEQRLHWCLKLSLWTAWSPPEQSYPCFKDQGDRRCVGKGDSGFIFCDSQPSVLSMLRWALSVTEGLLCASN